jgi:hypothetical protein
LFQPGAPTLRMRSSNTVLPTCGGLAYVRNGRVHIFPVRNVLQMRPDFSAIDAADEVRLNVDAKEKVRIVFKLFF